MPFEDHVRDIEAALARDQEVAAEDHLFLAIHGLPPRAVFELASRLIDQLVPHFRGGPGWFDGLEEELRRVEDVARDPGPGRHVSLDAWYMPASQVLPVAEVHFRAAIAGLLDAVDGRRFPEMVTSAGTMAVLEALAARVMVAWRAADPAGYDALNQRWRADVLGLLQGPAAGEVPVDPPEVVAERSQRWRELVAELDDLAGRGVPQVSDEPGAARALARWRKVGGVLYPPAETGH